MRIVVRRSRARTFSPWLLVACVASLGLALPHRAFAQDDAPRTEIGVFFGGIKLREVARDSPFALGGRVGRRVTDAITVEGEVAYCPQNPSGNYGETIVLGGIKLGRSWEPIGLFAKLRAGAIHFGGRAFAGENGGGLLAPAIDVGLVYEQYGRRIGWRVDVGDLIVPLGSTEIGSALPPAQRRQPGTTHNLQMSVGLIVRLS